MIYLHIFKHIYLIVSFLSIQFATEISKEQLDKIDDVTSDINKAPNFILNSVRDSVIVLDSLKGKVVLINFWATWCGPCIAEIPEFNSLLKKYEEKNFEILGISVNDTEQQLKKFITRFNVDYPLLFGSIEKMNTVIINYGGFNSVPVSYLINREGLVVRGYPGAIIGDYWTSVLENDIIKFLSDSIQFENNQ